jgi:hypothetical protein
MIAPAGTDRSWSCNHLFIEGHNNKRLNCKLSIGHTEAHMDGDYSWTNFAPAEAEEDPRHPLHIRIYNSDGREIHRGAVIYQVDGEPIVHLPGTNPEVERLRTDRNQYADSSYEKTQALRDLREETDHLRADLATAQVRYEQTLDALIDVRGKRDVLQARLDAVEKALNQS